MLPEGRRRQPKVVLLLQIRQGASQTFFQQTYAFTDLRYPSDLTDAEWALVETWR
jgi:hypothetical protein